MTHFYIFTLIFSWTFCFNKQQSNNVWYLFTFFIIFTLFSEKFIAHVAGEDLTERRKSNSVWHTFQSCQEEDLYTNICFTTKAQRVWDYLMFSHGLANILNITTKTCIGSKRLHFFSNFCHALFYSSHNFWNCPSRNFRNSCLLWKKEISS